MSEFSADWLALREAADLAARSPLVLDACRAYFAEQPAISVCDLGSGTGAAVRAFHELLPEQQRWHLVDNASANLAETKRRTSKVVTAVETQLCDLAENPTPWLDHCELVTATALFDLASPGWIGKLCEALTAQRLPILATLTYDGHQALTPAHPADTKMIAAFNQHQHLDKGLGGPAAGPTSTDALVVALEVKGYDITKGPSPWRLDGTKDAALIAETLKGWATAVTDAGFVSSEVAADWLAFRLAQTASYEVGHTDVFAVPSKRA
jgi:hypothetical protein